MHPGEYRIEHNPIMVPWRRDLAIWLRGEFLSLGLEDATILCHSNSDLLVLKENHELIPLPEV
jgi:hypothetical protein